MKKNTFLTIFIVLTAVLGSMITGCGNDTIVPTISDATATSITDSSATVTWTTSEPSTSQLQYGTDASYHTVTTLDLELKTTHSVTIDRLASETAYHFSVKAKDAADNLAVSDDATFNTTIDATPNRTATIVTSKGTIKIELYENRAPITTANFIALANSDFYDGLIFHRVIDDFMIQTGDPDGTGSGGSDETIDLEIHPELRFIHGAVGMARGNTINSATSQFFICDGTQTNLDGDYAVFGQVIGEEEMDVVRRIAAVEVIDTTDNKPLFDVTMISVTIE